MLGFENDPDPQIRGLVEWARKKGWFDEEPGPLPPISKETWDEGGWPVTRLTFDLGHILAAGLHPQDFNSTPEERLEHRVREIEEMAWEVLRPTSASPTGTNEERPCPSVYERGSAQRVAAEILQLAASARSKLEKQVSAADVAEVIQKLEQKRIALRDLSVPHPKDGPNGRPTAQLIEKAAASKAAPRKRVPRWLQENRKKLSEMYAQGKTAWAMAGFIAKKYGMDQNSLSSQIKRRIKAGELDRPPQIF